MTSISFDNFQSSYSQAMVEIQIVEASVNSLESFVERVVNILKDKFDFIFVGLMLLDISKESIKRLSGTGNGYQKKLLSLSVNIDNAITRVIRNGRPLMVRLNDDFFVNPDFPNEKVQFFLPLRSQNGVFGVMEIVSSKESDADNALKLIPFLEILLAQTASHCLKLLDTSQIGFWLTTENKI